MDILVRKLTQTKVLVFLAIILVGSMVYVKIMRNKTIPPAQQVIVPTAMPTTKPVVTPVEAFDLDGQYVCKNGSSDVVISKKRAYVENKSEQVPSYTIFDGECLYAWKKNSYQGSKKCGFSQFVGAYEMLSKMGVASDDMLISTIMDSGILNTATSSSKSAKTPNAKTAKEAFAKSCHKTDSVDEKLFVAPKSVRFVEQKET